MEFCSVEGCYELAIGLSFWVGRGARQNPHPSRPSDRCRAHDIKRAEGTFVRCEVTAPDGVEIVDIRTMRDVGRGGFVELDPAQTHIPSLVYNGFVRVLPDEEC